MPSRMEVLPEAFGPRTRVVPGARVSSARSMQRKFSSASSARGMRPLEPHRHDDVLGVRRSGSANQAAAVGISEADLDAIGVDRAQSIQQVVYIEPDLALITLIVDLDFILSLF